MKKIILISLCVLLSLTTTTHKAQAQWNSNVTSVFLMDSTKLVGIGTSIPNAKLDLHGKLNIRSSSSTKIQLNADSTTDDNWITSYDQNANRRWILNMADRSANNMFRIWSEAIPGYVFNIDVLGRVGIGYTPNSSYMLQVCGSIRANEVRVQTGWCDYVFNDNYELRSLKDVKEFIKENKHLPDITPGNIIEREGLQLGETSSQMIKKIEENTLYLIQHDERIEALETQLETLAKENQNLKNEIKKLKSRKGPLR